MTHLDAIRRSAAALLLGCAAIAGGCSATPQIDDPQATLTDYTESEREHLAAMEILDQTAEDDEAYDDALKRAIWRPGYTWDVRVAAIDRLETRDPEGLQRTLRQQLPRISDYQTLTGLCEIISDRGWVELTPALASSWARPLPNVDDIDRPEYIALAKLHGKDQVADVVFELLVESRKVSQQGLRTRCWTLLQRIGQRDRLIALLASNEVPADDVFLLDLQRSARELGMVPHNREEILWIRKLCEPQRQEFWNEAVAATQQLSPERRAELEVRDLPVLVSAARHRSELLQYSKAESYAALEDRLAGQRHYAHGSDVGSYNQGDRLREWRGKLTWGDLAAMHMALDAMAVSQIQAHLFDYAERDKEDESTEYGGVIQLDRQGRFEVIEFLPRVRKNDRMFIASQEMLDQAYTSLFHFHLHVQKYRNQDYAGPGFGDVNYATNTRANCLVLTFVREGALNVDFYRRDSVQVDLGEIGRP